MWGTGGISLGGWEGCGGRSEFILELGRAGEEHDRSLGLLSRPWAWGDSSCVPLGSEELKSQHVLTVPELGCIPVVACGRG